MELGQKGPKPNDQSRLRHDFVAVSSGCLYVDHSRPIEIQSSKICAPAAVELLLIMKSYL